MSEKSSGCFTKGCCLGCTGCAGLIFLVIIVISVGLHSFFSNPLQIPDKVFLTEDCAGYINLAANPDNQAAVKLLQKFVADIARENPEHAAALSNFDEKTLQKFLPMSASMALYPAPESVKPVICLRLNTLGFFTKFMGWFFQFVEKKHHDDSAGMAVTIADNKRHDTKYTCYTVGKWKYICEFEGNNELKPNVAFLDNNMIITFSRKDMEWAIQHIEKSIAENKTYKNPAIEEILGSFPENSFGKGVILKKEGFAFSKILPFITGLLSNSAKDTTAPPPFDTDKVSDAISRIDLKIVPENELILVNFDFLCAEALVKEQLKEFFEGIKGKSPDKKDDNTSIDIFKTEISEDRISLSTIIHYSK